MELVDKIKKWVKPFKKKREGQDSEEEKEQEQKKTVV